MKKLFLLLLLIPTLAHGQINVTAVVKDQCNREYQNGFYDIDLVVPPNATQKVLYGGSVFQQRYVGNLDSFGNLGGPGGVFLYDNNLISDGLTPSGTQWKFTICATRNAPYNGIPCFTATMTITGASPQDISTSLDAAAALLVPGPCPGGGGGTTHNLLSPTHLDTVPFSPPTIGDLIRGGLANLWQRFAVGTDSQILAVGPGTALPTWNNFNFYQNSVTPVNSAGRLGVNLIAGTNVSSITAADDPTNNRVNYTVNVSGGATGSKTVNIDFDQCSPSIATHPGDSFWTITNLTNFDFGHWEFKNDGQGVIWCTVRVPINMNATPAAKVIIDLSNNATNAAISTNWQTCDVITSALNINVVAPSCAPAQAFAQQTTAYKQVELTFAVQSTLVANQYLVVKIFKVSADPYDANVLMQPPKLQITEDF